MVDLRDGYYKNILLIKYYGVGFGDNIRGTAAWNSLREKYNHSNIHVLFWANKIGTPCEWIYSSSGLFSSVSIVEKKEIRNFLGKWTTLESWKNVFSSLKNIKRRYSIDLVIDQEVHGLEGAILSAWFRAQGITALGVGEYPIKSLFYTKVGPSQKRYAKINGLDFPLEYTEKDYLSLQPLGITRKGQRITIPTPPNANKTLTNLLGVDILSDIIIVGINIGCGYAKNDPRRPELSLYKNLLEYIMANNNRVIIVLTGTSEESWLNEECIRCVEEYKNRIFNIAGRTNIEELAGVVSLCECYISTDSGPYHLSVALGCNTIGLFRWNNRTCFHTNDKTWNIVVGDRSEPTAIINILKLLRVVT